MPNAPPDHVVSDDPTTGEDLFGDSDKLVDCLDRPGPRSIGTPPDVELGMTRFDMPDVVRGTEVYLSNPEGPETGIRAFEDATLDHVVRDDTTTRGGLEVVNPQRSAPLAVEPGADPHEIDLGLYPGSGETTQGPLIGMNCLHAYARTWDTNTGQVVDTTKYGGDAAPIVDAGLLGASIVRQPGQRDLEWAMMAADASGMDGLRNGQNVYTDGSGPRGRTLRNQLETRPDGTSNAEWMAEMLLEAYNSGQRVLLTFMSKGSSGAGGIQVGMPEDDSFGVDWERTVTVDGRTYTLMETSIQPRKWSQQHVGESLDGELFPVQSDNELRVLPWRGYRWHLQSLDVSSSYKRAFTRKIAETMAEVLVDAGTILKGEGLSLEDVVAGIELFNEVDQYSRYSFDPRSSIPPSPERFENTESGKQWGAACLQAAWGFHRILEDAGVAEIPIRLPGITSYTSLPNVTWESRGDFIEGLIEGFVGEAVGYLTSRTGPNLLDEEVGELLPRLLGGIDYHWYHTQTQSGTEEARHIGYLVTEVAEIEEAVIETTNQAWFDTTDEPTPILDSFPVSTMETGVSATNNTEFLPSGVAATLLLNGNGATCSKRELFQAWEVCRRLGGALASGAEYVGWHAWMSAGGSGGFSGYGLRNDAAGSFASASAAYQRASWFVYERLTSVLSRTEEGEMAVPEDIGSREELEDFLAGTDVHPWVVFAYRGSFTVPKSPTAGGECPQFETTIFNHAWLVMLDPTVNRRPERHLYAGWSLPRSADAQAVVVPLAHQRIAKGYGGTHKLPLRRAVYPPCTLLNMTTAVRFDLNYWDGPVLILSTEELAWSHKPMTSRELDLGPGEWVEYRERDWY